MTAGTRITEGKKKNDSQKGLGNELMGQLLRMHVGTSQKIRAQKEKAKSRLHDFERIY